MRRRDAIGAAASLGGQKPGQALLLLETDTKNEKWEVFLGKNKYI